jgi:hypothetical protein
VTEQAKTPAPTDLTAPPPAPAPAPAEKQPATPMPPADPDDPGDESKPTDEEVTIPGKPVAAPDPSKLVESAMQKRDAKQLAALVREKKVYEAGQTKLKEAAPRLSVMDEFDRLFEDDPAAALEYMVAHKAGDPERARAALAAAYDGLTSRILGVESKAPVNVKVERSVSRLEQRLQQLEQEKTQAEAKLAQREAAEAEQRIQGAKSYLGELLQTDELQKAYPYFFAESNDPTEEVWALMNEAEEAGLEMTVGEAADLMNKHHQPTVEKKKDRYKNLLAPTKGSDTPSKPETPKSQNGTSRKSLTNADASAAPSPTKKEPTPRTENERREMSWAKLREGHKR